jgi:NADH dehydrogenase
MLMVVGATGMLGGLVTRDLLRQGRPVRVLARSPEGAGPLAAAGAEPVYGDLKDPPSLAAALRGVDTVVTTANSAMRGGDDTIQTVDIEGNRHLVDAARSAGVRQFVFVSALGAGADSPVPLMQAKGRTEDHLRASGIPYTILAPNAFMEVWAPRVVGAPAKAGQPVTLVGEGRRRHSFVSMWDVAKFVVKAVGNSAAVDRYLPIGGPQALSWRDVVAVYERALGRPIPVRFVAPGDPLPGLPDPMPALLAGFETYDSPVDMAELARAFDVQLTSLDEFAREDVATPR